MFILSKDQLKNAFIKYFNVCFFVSLCLLSLYPDLISKITLAPEFIKYWGLPITNGIVCSFCLLMINRRLPSKKLLCHKNKINYKIDKISLLTVSFIAGFCSVYISFSALWTYIVSGVVFTFSVINIKIFICKLSALLKPNTLATKQTVGDFFNFLINMIISFTVINLVINTIYFYAQGKPAFNFASDAHVIDAFYFSIITMATVGYGDISPQTVIAKLLVSLECLTSYLLLGIMIGFITRGIDFDHEK